MIKTIGFLAISAISAALASSIAWAQTYAAVNYPGAAATEIVGGPNPQDRALVYLTSQLAAQITVSR